MIDQRRFARVKVLLPAEVTVEGQAPFTRSAVCLDLSATGLLCQTDEKIPVGSIVRLRLQLAENDDFVLDAKVVRGEKVRQPSGYRIALEFAEPSFKLMERVTYFLLYPREPFADAMLKRVRAPFEM